MLFATAYGHSKIGIQLGAFELIFLCLALMLCNGKSKFYEFETYALRE